MINHPSKPVIRRGVLFCALNLLLLTASSPAQTSSDADALKHSVEQLRSSVGRWDVTTELLDSEGSVTKAVSGTYEFSWVVPDRVVSGKSEIPELKQVSAILFYIHEAKKQIEMVAVGADGKLWVMTGALGEEVRTTGEFKTASGGVSRLRFTRYNVSKNSFESKMEYTVDGGKSWLPGNHQIFRRATVSQP